MSTRTTSVALPAAAPPVAHGDWVAQGSQFYGLYAREVLKTFRNPWVLVITLVQPFMWLAFFGSSFANVPLAYLDQLLHARGLPAAARSDHHRVQREVLGAGEGGGRGAGDRGGRPDRRKEQRDPGAKTRERAPVPRSPDPPSRRHRLRPDRAGPRPAEPLRERRRHGQQIARVPSRRDGEPDPGPDP